MMRYQFTTNKKGLILSIVGVVLVIFLSQIEGIVGAFRAEDLLQNGYSADLILTALSSDWIDVYKRQRQNSSAMSFRLR